VSFCVPSLTGVREGLCGIQVSFWVIPALALIFELQWEKGPRLVASCREILVQPQMGTAAFNMNFTLTWKACETPEACLFGVTNAYSSFSRARRQQVLCGT